MSLREKLQKGSVERRRREVIDKIGVNSEKYRNKEILGFGFPELYLLAETEYYCVLGNMEEITTIIEQTYGVNHYKTIGPNVLMFDRDKAETLFAGMYTEYNLFEKLTDVIITCYPETSRDPLRGVAYHISKCLEEDKLDYDVLMYMGEVLSRKETLWMSFKEPSVRVNATKSFTEVLERVHEIPNITKVDIGLVSGDLNDFKAELESRLEELKSCSEYLNTLLNLRKLRGVSDLDKNKSKENLEWLKLLIYGSAEEIRDKVVKINEGIDNFDEKRQIDFLQRYRGEFVDLTTQVDRIDIILNMGLPKADIILMNSKDNSDKSSKKEGNLRRLKERFESIEEVEFLKLKYVNVLLSGGSISKDAYYANMLV